MAKITDGLPIIGATDANGEDRVQDGKPFTNVLYVSNDNGSDTIGKGNTVNPFKTIQKALDTFGVPTTDAQERNIKRILLDPGQYDEELTIPAAGLFHILGLGPWILGVGDGDSGQTNPTKRSITWTVDPTKQITNRPALYIGVIN